jgi:hypothetical protein
MIIVEIQESLLDVHASINFRRRHCTLKVTVVSGDTLISDLRDTCPDEEIDLEHHLGVRSR